MCRDVGHVDNTIGEGSKVPSVITYQWRIQDLEKGGDNIYKIP